MTVIQHMDKQTFLANVRQSGLLTSEQLTAALPNMPDTERGRIVARVLVEKGLLTKFQAELLLAGRTSGFHLGQYRILDQLGKGGMGRIFKAEHQTMNRIVALKVMASALVKTERAQQMFQREVRAAARLVHPNIVTAYDANQIGGRYYLVMEFVNGPNLEELVREHGPLPVGQACDFIRQAAIGLQYASEQGMVHRDVKPSNLLVQRSIHNAPGTPWVVKILDFGLAQLHARDAAGKPLNDSVETAANTVLGTPDYVSPEQARNVHKVDIRSDLYSLGCTFFFLLTAKVPFPGGTAMEKLVRHNTEEPKPIDRLRPDLPQPVAAIVRRLMAKDPAVRFQTPAELAAAIAPFAMQGAPGQAVSTAALAPTVTNSESAWADLTSQPADVEEDVAMIGTLPIDLGQTPMSAAGMPSMQMRRVINAAQSRRTWIAVILSLLFVIGSAAILAWLLLKVM